jgi:putative zinc finger/helix-turn-helix YgiT family protein
MKAPLWKCATCREKAVAQVVLPSYTAELDHDGRKYVVSISDLNVLRCEHCGAIVLDDEAEDRLVEGLRAKAGLLSPQEIRQKRESLRLTQKQLSNVLAISESTLSRWETGAQIQQRCMDKFLRCFFELPEVRRLLEAPETTWHSAPSRLIPVNALPTISLTSDACPTAWPVDTRRVAGHPPGKAA